MNAQITSLRRRKSAGALPAWVALLVLLLFLALTQANCVLITEPIYTRRVWQNYICKVMLVDTATGERRIVNSSMLGRTAPGAPARTLFNFDWNGDGTNNEADVLYDWRRYVGGTILSSTSFRGRSWCISPTETACDLQGTFYFTGAMPAALPDITVSDCSAASFAHLEVSAPGLTTDNQFSFSDTPVGNSSTPVTFTVTNRGTVEMRVNSIDFTGLGDAPDFAKTADGCQPTAAELSAGRGHLLGAGATCTFQLQFRPQHRDGVAECAAATPGEVCRRQAALFVTSEVDASRSARAPVNVRLSGHAIGGGIVTEPAEFCFPTAPPVGSCTAWQMLRIRNNSTGDLTLTSARLTRAGNRFEAPMPFLMAFTLPAGFPLDVSVRFCNVADDPTDGEFTINSSDPINPTTVVTLVNPLRRRCP